MLILPQSLSIFNLGLFPGFLFSMISHYFSQYMQAKSEVQFTHINKKSITRF